MKIKGRLVSFGGGSNDNAEIELSSQELAEQIKPDISKSKKEMKCG